MLKTIYFPNDSHSILYLSDKLPKPTYNRILEITVNESKLSQRRASESPKVSEVSKQELMPKTIKHQSKKMRNVIK